jgi:hypothetical protein
MSNSLRFVLLWCANAALRLVRRPHYRQRETSVSRASTGARLGGYQSLLHARPAARSARPRLPSGLSHRTLQTRRATLVRLPKICSSFTAGFGATHRRFAHRA